MKQYWASVSGGKDSVYMLDYILNNIDKYPLDGVVHFELEIDYPFIHDVINYIEEKVKTFGITMLRIKPRNTFIELYKNMVFQPEFIVGAIVCISWIVANSSRNF